MSLSPAQQTLAHFIEQAETRHWTGRDDQLRTMEDLYARIDHGTREGILLSFALAKIYDDLGEIEQSYLLLTEGNRHHQRGKTDTIADARSTIASVKQLFGSQTVTTLDKATSQQPLFVLGMPRSGTTLVEQILASHSAVYGGGELALMGQWCFGFLKLYQAHDRQLLLDNYLPQLQEHYLNGLRSMTSSRFVTDKMPVNFLWLGFILSAFPAAKIVHTVRDPMAVCWSIYKTPFAGTSNGYSCDLKDIGEFYRLYVDLMAFWNELFPGRIYQLDYEALTVNQTRETRKLLDYCGLGWEDQCLEFHRNPREVRTVSRHQVKKPMYQGSSEAWKRYEPFLDSLKEALGPALS